MQTQQEVVVVVEENGEVVAIMRKNGTTQFYKTRKMGFDDVSRLMEQLNEHD